MRATSRNRRAASPFVGPITVGGSVPKRAPGSTKPKAGSLARPQQIAELVRLADYVQHDYDVETLTSRDAQRYIMSARSWRQRVRRDAYRAKVAASRA